jgi:DNA-binding transcriptional MerR regulator
MEELKKQDVALKFNSGIEEERGVQGVLFDIYTDADHQLLDGYSAPKVCKIVGITYRQLDYWTRTDLLSPSIKNALGQGTKRIYSFKDILLMKVIKSLLDTGLSLQQIRIATTYLRDLGIQDLSQTTLISDGHSVYKCTSDDDVIDLLRRGQGVFGISVTEVYKEIHTKIRDISLDARAIRKGKLTLVK